MGFQDHGHRSQRRGAAMPARFIFLDLPALLVPYVPNFQYFLYDLTTIEDSQIQGDLILQAGLLSLKYARNEKLKDKLEQIFELIDQLGDSQKVRAGRRARTRISGHGTLKGIIIIRYLWSTSPINREDINTALVETFSKEGDSIMKTIAQTYIEQGRKSLR